MLVGVVACAVAFAGGVWSAPHTGVAAVVQPLLLNAVHVAAAVLCLRAARRVPEERLAWQGAAVAWSLSLAGNVLFALTAASTAEPPFPSIADAAWLASYPALYVVAVVLLVVRVRHLGLSTWLDGLIGALGITAVAATLFITPSVQSRDLDGLAVAATYAYPVADVLLLALLGAVMAILGLRGDLAVVLLCGILGSKLSGTCSSPRLRPGTATSPAGRSTSPGWPTRSSPVWRPTRHVRGTGCAPPPPQHGPGGGS